MTDAVRMRLDPDEPFAACDVAVDWFGLSNATSTVHVATGFFGDATPVPLPHRRLLEAAAAVYVADKCLPREQADNGWTRNVELHLPLPEGEQPIADELAETLGFLTGDRWDVAHDGGPAPWALGQRAAGDAELVCLFSGGLDSFAGAVELLEEGRRVVLVGHNETPIASDRQSHLARVLADAYPEQVELRQLYLRPAPRRGGQHQPVEVVEPSTRSRSLLFIAGGLSLAGTMGDAVPLYMPENGFIGINVPLARARTGSASTRTTHPRFMALLGRICETLGIANPIINPFRLATKGEVVQRVAHVDVFREHARDTVSCSHPEEGRWPREHPMTTPDSRNCGYCYPCLIRRAALHAVGWDEVGDYRWDAFDSAHVHGDGKAGADLRAVIHWLHHPPRLEDFARHGRVGGEARGFYEVHLRGHRELRAWLNCAPAGTRIRSLLP